MNTILKVNGQTHTLDVSPSTPLLYVLRNDLDLKGAWHFGCGLAQCGLCTVIIDGVATRSCVTPLSSVKGEVTTLGGWPRTANCIRSSKLGLRSKCRNAGSVKTDRS